MTILWYIWCFVVGAGLSFAGFSVIDRPFAFIALDVIILLLTYPLFMLIENAFK